MKFTDEMMKDIIEKAEGKGEKREAVLSIKMSAVCHYPKRIEEGKQNGIWAEDICTHVKKLSSPHLGIPERIAAALLMINSVLESDDLKKKDRKNFRVRISEFVSLDKETRAGIIATAVTMAVQPDRIKNNIVDTVVK